MNPAKFTDKKTGELTPIVTASGPDFAFIPASLPPKWEFPSALYPALIEARSALSKLDGIGCTIPDQELLLSPLKRREAITSSRIEGTYATAEELMLFEISETEAKNPDSTHAAWREVYNYSNALSTGILRLNELPFCGRLFKELHSILMKGVRGQYSISGEYRDHQVAIGFDRRYVPPPVHQMVEAINAFEVYLNELPDSYDPLVRAFLAHYQFEAIHPFADGNGRIGRVLLSLMISKWCNLSRPWLYMSAFFEKFKDDYIRNLFDVSAEGDWEGWIDFCLAGTIQQANDAISRCKKLGQLKSEMLERCRENCTVRSERIIESLFRNPFVRVAKLHKDHEIAYRTAQNDVDRLVEAKILERLGVGRPKTYYAPQIFRIAYAEIE